MWQAVGIVDLVTRHLIDGDAGPLELGSHSGRVARNRARDQVPALGVDDANHDDVGSRRPGRRPGNRVECGHETVVGRDCRSRLRESCQRLARPPEGGLRRTLRLI